MIIQCHKSIISMTCPQLSTNWRVPSFPLTGLSSGRFFTQPPIKQIINFRSPYTRTVVPATPSDVAIVSEGVAAVVVEDALHLVT